VRKIVSQVAELCAAGGVPLSTVTNRDLAASLAAAEKVAPDKAAVSLIKSLATRAMSEAQYFSAGEHIMASRPPMHLTFAPSHVRRSVVILLTTPMETQHKVLQVWAGACPDLQIRATTGMTSQGTDRDICRRHAARRHRRLALWTGARVLHTLHIAHQALRRPGAPWSM